MDNILVIEREWSNDLAIEYSTEDLARRALTESLFIDGICEEDCLDAYTTDTIPDGAEHILPPSIEEDSWNDADARCPSCEWWEGSFDGRYMPEPCEGCKADGFTPQNWGAPADWVRPSPSPFMVETAAIATENLDGSITVTARTTYREDI